MAIGSLWTINCSDLHSGILDGADANWLFCRGVGKQLSVQFVYIHKLVPFQWAIPRSYWWLACNRGLARMDLVDANSHRFDLPADVELK